MLEPVWADTAKVILSIFCITPWTPYCYYDVRCKFVNLSLNWISSKTLKLLKEPRKNGTHIKRYSVKPMPIVLHPEPLICWLTLEISSDDFDCVTKNIKGVLLLSDINRLVRRWLKNFKQAPVLTRLTGFGCTCKDRFSISLISYVHFFTHKQPRFWVPG